MNRPDWDRYFLDIAHIVSKRSTCLKRQVGAVLVKDRYIIATGYNGAAKSMPHCSEEGCLRVNVPSGERHEICKAIHAEQNTIAQAAMHGLSTEGATLYCMFQPCFICAKILVNAGVKRVVYEQGYPDENTLKYLSGALELIKY